MMRLALLIILTVLLAYVATVDSCLIGNAPESYFRSHSTIGLGLSMQAAALVMWAVGLIRKNDSRSALAQLLSSPGRKIVIFLAALAALWFSLDIVAYGLYNAGSNNKLESSRMVDAALKVCHSI